MKKSTSLIVMLGMTLLALFLSTRESFTPPPTKTLNPLLGTNRLGPLRVLEPNRRYFTVGDGKALYLAGSHTWQDLMDKATIDVPTAMDYPAFLDFLHAHNHNLFRLWTWWFANDGSADQFENFTAPPFPWVRSGPGMANDGKPRFDLNHWDQSYFDRMRSRIVAAGKKQIYVVVMLFNGWEFQFASNSVDGDPFADGNNVNGISCGGICPNTFPLEPVVMSVELTYIRKVIDTVNDLDNVLYEVSNEAGSPYSDAWQASIISYVKQYEATKPKQHPIGMTFQYEGGSDVTLYSSEADWISPGTALPRDGNGIKVIVNDTDHSCSYNCLKKIGQTGQMEWAWENFTRGNNLLFMDPYLVQWPGRNSPSGSCSGGQCSIIDPYWEVIRDALGDVRSYADKIDLANMTPQDALTEHHFCLANPGSQYLVFNQFTGPFVVYTVPGTYTYEWFNPTSHSVTGTGRITVGTSFTFTPSFFGDSVLWLRK